MLFRSRMDIGSQLNGEWPSQVGLVVILQLSGGNVAINPAPHGAPLPAFARSGTADVAKCTSFRSDWGRRDVTVAAPVRVRVSDKSRKVCFKDNASNGQPLIGVAKADCAEVFSRASHRHFSSRN